MAKRSKKSSNKRVSTTPTEPDTVEDAVVVSETGPEDETLDTALADEAKEALDAEPVEDIVGDELAAKPEPIADETPVDERAPEEPPVEETVVEPGPDPVVAPAEPAQKSGFVPLAIGGLVAGGIGYGAALLGAGDNTEMQALIEAQAERIETLSAEVAALPDTIELPEVPDIAPLQGAVEILQTEAAALAGAQDGIATETAEATSAAAAVSEALGAIDERLTAVERAPGEDGAVTDTAIASFERELAGLREELASQESRMVEVAETATAQLAATREAATAELTAAREAAAADLAAVRAEAEAEEAAARAEAEAALAAAAVSELRVAVESGAPFDEAVASLTEVGVDVPEAISSAAADGVQTQAALIGAFPDLARAALDTARDEGAGDSGSGGVGSFFRDQLGARSVEPREGDDPDAVLSRAEAAAGAGDLDAALTEIDALPDSVKAVFADWAAQADSRDAVLAALTELDASVN